MLRSDFRLNKPMAIGGKGCFTPITGYREFNEAGRVGVHLACPPIFKTNHLTRIIHQPEKSTREGPFGGQLILNTTVCQDHHDPKASSSESLGSGRSGRSVAMRRTAS